MYRINDTTAYHREGMKTLGWELTISNALEDGQSPCRSVNKKNASFGRLLIDHLYTVIPRGSVTSSVEIGGGYGLLTRDLLRVGGIRSAAMVDLSPVLLNRQKEALKGLQATFIQNDFFKLEADFFRQFDLAVLNEVVGDFPTICDINPGIFSAAEGGLDPMMSRVKNLYVLYGFLKPATAFNFNIGAVKALETLCSARTRAIYLSEHSCEATVPEDMRGLVRITSPGDPERISLHGHDEYTVKFSHLESVARYYNYRVKRGRYADFISPVINERVNFIMTSNSQKDEHEMIRQFIEDLYKYEYLILVRD